MNADVKMRVLFINSISRTKFGGGEKWMVKAAKGLTEAGHCVYLASKRDAEILKAAEQAGVRTHIINVRSDVSPLNTWRIARFLKKEQIQVLVCNLNKDVRVAGLAARLVKRPVVIARHGVQLCGKAWKHKVTLTHLTDGILTNTESIKRAYLDYGWFDDDFVEVIYNGIEARSDVRAHDFSREHPDKKVIFSAGRLSEQKGFSYLIDAAEMILNQRDDVVFFVAGKGRREKELKQRVHKRNLDDAFHFCGFHENIESYLKGCDLFVLSSLYEGMPNVVMEAMAVGKAVLATDVNGVRELVVDGETGVIVPSGSAESLAEAIEALIDDPRRLEALGQAGLNRVQEHFTISAMIKNLERYFLAKWHEKEKRADSKNN